MQSLFIGLTLLVSCKYEIGKYVLNEKQNYSIKLYGFLSWLGTTNGLDQGYRKNMYFSEIKTCWHDLCGNLVFELTWTHCDGLGVQFIGRIVLEFSAK